jgi:succinate-semialdehyde dehydrogenase/glutarate-semialdehyde dehydrogenase
VSFLCINPTTGRRLRAYRTHTARETDRILSRADAAFRRWRDWSLEERAGYLRSVARLLRRRAPALAQLITAEMGKPLAQARAEIEKSAVTCEYYARYGPRYLAPEIPVNAPKGARVLFQPLGTVLAIMPWNFPVWQAVRAAAPALMAGNTFVLKHAANVTGCAHAVARLFADAGGRRGPGAVFQLSLLPNESIAAVIADPRVHAVTLTGSTGAGKKVAATAGRVMKKGVFELGGSDAYLILADANLDLAAEVCAASRLINSGQSCVCAKRFIVVASVRREFEQKFVARLRARRVGDPLDPKTDVGPLARRDLRDKLHAQVSASVKAGARLVMGGRPLPGRGFFYAPTLLTGVKPGMAAYDEELFGPAAALISVPNEAAAIRVANDSIYGLGAAVFSRNRSRARAVAAKIEAGAVFINDFVRSDAALPFGGIKQSGHGRELGAFGIREFVNIKTVLG